MQSVENIVQKALQTVLHAFPFFSHSHWPCIALLAASHSTPDSSKLTPGAVNKSSVQSMKVTRN